MTTFGKYARFYDDLYQDKDYKKECDFIEKVLKKFSSREIRTILDLGCGTASHDILLAKRGYDITGIDVSSEMLKIAKQKIKREGLKISLHKGNIQTARLGKKFDAVISMFNVMGYQITNKAFEKALVTARAHLKKGGLFVFDVWFGPAVLNDKSKSKTKVVYGTEGEKITRRSKCQADIANQVVEISFITEKHFKRRLITRNRECHRIHFFFPNEIRILLKKSGLTTIKICPFSKLEKRVMESDWNIAVVSERAKP